MILRSTKGSHLTIAEMDGNLTEFDTRLAKPDKGRVGWADYNDATTAITPIATTGGTTWYQITNDAAGALTNEDYLPEGVTSLWDSTNDQFDFSELNIGDQVIIRATMVLTTSANNQEVDFRLVFGIGDPSEYSLQIAHLSYKVAGEYPVAISFPFHIGNTFTRDNPAELQVRSDGNLSIEVEGFYIPITLRGEVA